LSEIIYTFLKGDYRRQFLWVIERIFMAGPVEADCEWSEWSGWSLCSISCGTGGERRR
jgi:hypothetical protein